MVDIASDRAVQVVWREGTWRCESATIQARPVLRLYDGDRLELEHEVVPGTIPGTAEAMRQSVLRYLAGQCGIVADNTSRRGDTKVIGPGHGVFTVCRQCRSLRAYLRARRPARDWYFCPDCHHQWDVAAGIPGEGRTQLRQNVRPD
jgi:hypothetical protein